MDLPKVMCNKLLKSGWGIGDIEWHNLIGESFPLCDESEILLALLQDSNLELAQVSIIDGVSILLPHSGFILKRKGKVISLCNHI